jgi:hypothetical protein
LLDWEPKVSLDEGLESTLKYFKQQINSSWDDMPGKNSASIKKLVRRRETARATDKIW